MKRLYWILGIFAFLSTITPLLLISAAKKPVHGKGLLRNTEKFKRFLKSVEHREKKAFSAELPASGDLSSIASLPRNQGGCGDCWAYALTKALQSELMIAGTSPSSLLDVGYLTGNCGGPIKEYGCNGGDFPAGQNFLNGKGPWANGVDPAGENGCKKLMPAGTALKFIMLGTENSPPTDQEMVQTLSEKHVLAIDVAADDSWTNYPAGTSDNIWSFNTSSSIDHMINRVGWKCATTSADGKYCAFDADGNSPGIVYLDMNNWGEDWGVVAPNGHGGYIYETRLANQSGQSAAYFTVKQPTPPPAPPTPPTPPSPPAPCGPCVPLEAAQSSWGTLWTVVQGLGIVSGVAALILILLKKN